jgi:hypothetical protein
MTNTTIHSILKGLCGVSAVITFAAATAVAQTTTKEIIHGDATVTTEKLSGVVTYVEGNTLVVKMSTGEMRTFTVPESRKFVIDGKELTVHDLKPGTSLSATLTTTTTPITERTTTNGTATVWFVNGSNVILTLPDGTNKMYKAKSDFKFKVNDQEATVGDLRKGMKITVLKIVAEPRTEIATNTTVVGSAPRAKQVVAQAAPPAPAPVKRASVPPPAPVAAVPPPPPVQVAAAQAPTPAPVQVAAIPAKLPTTGSPFPMAGALGLLFTGVGLGLRALRRS